MPNGSAPGSDSAQSDLETFRERVQQHHGRVSPCFMTGKGCVYTDQIDQTLADRGKTKCAGFMIMPFRPRLRVFFQNCLRPFFFENYSEERGDFTLDRADDVSRPGIIICEGVCKRIQESDFVIADISVPNENVFYELGLAYGIGHKIVLIHQDGAAFGTEWAKFFRSAELGVKKYSNLDPIEREHFRVSDYIWRRSDTSRSNEGDGPKVLFFEMMSNGDSEPEPTATAVNDVDINLSFRTHVMSDIGLALGKISKTLRETGHPVPSEYLEGIIEAHLNKAEVLVPKDPFEQTQAKVDRCYCMVVRTGRDCHPMSYFWLGYAHALGKNVIPITQLIVNEGHAYPVYDESSTADQQFEMGGRASGSRGEVLDLAFDIRAQRHMTFDPRHPERLEHQLERTLSEMIRADFAEWSRKRFWTYLLGSRGEVSIITGGLHSEDHNREMIGDWDLRTASELASYFSRHQYRPKIETPIYQPEFAKKLFGRGMTTQQYIEEVTNGIRIEDKNCIVIASPDVNPLTEILLGKLYGIDDEHLFSNKMAKEDYPADAIVVFKQRRATNADLEVSNDRRAQTTESAPRAFYIEELGEAAVEERGFRSRQLKGGDTKLLKYYGQNEYEECTNGRFEIYAQLVVARNPFTSPGSEPKFVVILNGVSGPATFALTHVITGGGNEEFEWYEQTGFDPASKAETILNKLLKEMLSRDSPCFECVVRVTVGAHDTSPELAAEGRPIGAPGVGATFDWRRILGWELDTDVLGTEVKAR